MDTNSKKIRVGILFGGKSAEHEVSLRSAKSIYEALDKEKYEPVLIGIDKSGKWLLSDSSSKMLLGGGRTSIEQDTPDTTSVALAPQSDGSIANMSEGGSAGSIDVVFPILHGPFGEDGTVQGLLKLANIPFVGASVLGSAVGMDKDVMKRLLRDAGIQIGKFITVRAGGSTPIPTYEEAVATLGTPLFIKPANLGSSVGVSKVKNKEEYATALKEAFKFDVKVLIEEFIAGREIECSVLGNEDPIVSMPGEVAPTSGHEFYSYEAKYLDENGARLEIPAKLSPEITKRVQDAAIATFKALCCEGLGRVDSFVKEDGAVFVNEINTMPGFTSISMYPKLWEASGIKYPELVDRLIQLAMERFEKEKQLKNSYT